VWDEKVSRAQVRCRVILIEVFPFSSASRTDLDFEIPALRLHPIQRLGTVAEIVDALLFLEQASFVSGEVVHVDGGAHAGKW